MTKNVKPLTFEAFIEYFPEIDLPVVLTQESIHSFSSLNTPLPLTAIVEYLSANEEEEDPYTEYVSCFRFKVTESVLAIVFWKGTLLSYNYELWTIDLKRREIISKKIIGGTKVIDNIILRSDAVISADFEVEVLVNRYESSDQIYPTKSLKYHIEIMDDGFIHSELEEEK